MYLLKIENLACIKTNIFTGDGTSLGISVNTID